MNERNLARLGGLAGVLSVAVTFAGFALHSRLPDATTQRAVSSYLASVSPTQTGIGNYIELLGYLLFMAFAAFLYSVARDAQPFPRSWLAIAGLAAAVAYVAATTIGISAQQGLVEWSKAGADAKTALGLYVLSADSFPLSFELSAMFLAGTGAALLDIRGPVRVLALAALALALVMLVCGFAGAASPGNGLLAFGFLLFLLWTLVAGVYFTVRPISAHPRT